MTDDEICGAPTDGGTPCQNPPTEGDHCWLDGHGGDVQVGRDPKLTRERQEQIAEMLEDGHSVAAACRCNGIGQSTFYQWLENADQQDEGIYVEFADRVARARGVGERKLVDELLEIAREEQDTRTILSVLKNRFPEAWGDAEANTGDEERIEVYLTGARD